MKQKLNAVKRKSHVVSPKDDVIGVIRIHAVVGGGIRPLKIRI
jgi:hypothetical protein